MGHVSQVYWPKSLLDRSHGGGYVIGFNVNSLVVVVVGVRETITEDLIPRHRLLDRILAETGGPPKVLGYLKGTRAKQGQDSNKVVDKQADLWFVFDQNPANKWPVLTGVYCYGYLHTSSPQIVFYDQPKHRNQLVYSSEALSIFPSTPDQYHPVQQDAKAEELGIDLTLKQIQNSWIINEAIQRPPAELDSLADPDDVTLGGNFNMTMFITALMWFFNLFNPLWKFLSQTISQWMTQSKNESALMWAIKTTFSQSMTLNHWNYRLHLFSTWPTIWGHRKFHGITWVHFYNRILLLILDVILGLTIGYYVWHNHFWVIEIAGQAYQWLRQNVLEAYIDWLMGWPGGFKLNEYLDLFLGRLFLLYIRNWAVLTGKLYPFAPFLTRFVACLGIFGASTQISIISDTFIFLSCHVRLLFLAISKAFFIQLRSLSTLWLLFRGKKQNVLRKRIDSVDYKPDQLLIGTISFCVLAFLVPTTWTYYMFFLIVRLGILSANALLNVLLVILNHFPLYGVILKLTKSRKLSGGIRFKLCLDSDGTKKPLARERANQQPLTSSMYLVLKSNPKFSVGMFFVELITKLKEIKIKA